MDAGRFDRLATAAAPRAGRRLAIGGLLGGGAAAMFGQGIDAEAKKRCKKCDRCPARCACVCDDQTCVFGDYTDDPDKIPAVCQKACAAAGWNNNLGVCAPGKIVSTTAVCAFNPEGLAAAPAQCPV